MLCGTAVAPLHVLMGLINKAFRKLEELVLYESKNAQVAKISQALVGKRAELDLKREQLHTGVVNVEFYENLKI